MFTRPRAGSRPAALDHPACWRRRGAAPSREPASAARAFPVTVHAANGTVKITARPTAIVSLSPTATEMLYAIGAGSQVKAVDLNSDYPPGVPRTQLDGNNPNVEAIAAYKPDLVRGVRRGDERRHAARRARHPGRERSRGRQPVPGVRAVRGARPGSPGTRRRPGRRGGARSSARSRGSSPRSTSPRAPRPTTTSSTRPTTRPPRARSSGSCSACSACAASRTPPRAPRPTAGTRS